MKLDPRLNSPGIWELYNTRNSRSYVSSSNNTSFGLSNMTRKLYYRDNRLPPLLIKDYHEGLLEFRVLELIPLASTVTSIVNEIILNLSKSYWIKLRQTEGISSFNVRPEKKYFYRVVPQIHFNLNHTKSRELVHVMISRWNSNPILTIGVFHTIGEARKWIKSVGGDLNNPINGLVCDFSSLTKTILSNPVLVDKGLLDLYRKLQ